MIYQNYYVNKQEHNSGYHEVHTFCCSFIPEEEHRQLLGSFENCHEAVQEAKKYYPKSKGCHYCSMEDNTGQELREYPHDKQRRRDFFNHKPQTSNFKLFSIHRFFNHGRHRGKGKKWEGEAQPEPF